MAASRARANFFSLPAELRVQIYELAFNPTGGVQEIQFPKKYENNGHIVISKVPFPAGWLSLLSTSRQVHNEALSIFRSNKIVHVDILCQHYGIMGTGTIIDVHLIPEGDRSRLVIMAPTQCSMLKKVMLRYRFYKRYGEEDAGPRDFPVTTEELFNKFELGQLGVKLSSCELERIVTRS